MPADTRSPPGLVIKRHNIRIWCHDCDMSRLQRVVWEGHGTRLLSEVSNQPVVRKFLEAVPYIMNTIRDIHQAVVANDLEALMKHSGDPVPPQALSSRDQHNMTVMHKAAGLGHGGILKYITDRYPQGINDVDNDGRTPLHYAAAMRDDQHTYNTLVSLGADESVVDNKNKTPAYYVNRPQEIDKNLFKTIPDAPRTPSSAYPSSWDWKLLDNYVITEVPKRTKKKNFRASTENISSKATSNTISDSISDHRAGVMKASSTHEFIKDLPELDEAKITNNEQQHIEEKDEENSKENKEAEDHEANDENEKEVTEETFDGIEHTVAENKTEEEREEENTNDHEEVNENYRNTSDHDEAEDHEEGEGHEEEENHDESENQEETDDHVDTGDHVEAENQAETDDHVDAGDHVESENQVAVEDLVEEEDDVEPESGTEQEDHEETGIGEHVPNHANDKEHTNSESPIMDIEDARASPNKNNDENSQLNTSQQHIQDNDMNTPQQHQNNDTPSDVKENGDTQNYSEAAPKNNNIENTSEENHHYDLEEHTAQENGQDDYNKSSHKIRTKEDDDTTTTEGNNNSSAINEDDDDVQVQGDTNSEYGEYNLKSTAEASNIGSAKIGREGSGRNTQESLIEGVINGEAEQDSEDASITQRDESVHGEVLVVNNETDPEVPDLINNANMEMLATLVLNGEGSRLIGRRSGNGELQGFLDNVPIYMKKINQVHVAAKEGNLKDLQAALDRRKFAIARDPVSPNGATPMHVATVHGKTNIIKYLGSRFPETLSAVDFEGRSALHYAAVLPDNGHYYNLMQQLGANSKDLDDNGSSAEDYIKNPDLLPFEQLLSDFGISEEAAQTMFSDKGPTVPDNGHMDIPIFQTEEGRYLAKSLGDPLIKGLTEVASVKPKDPVAFLASFLHNFPEHEKPRVGTPQEKESNIVVAQEAEVENEESPMLAAAVASKLPRSAARTDTRSHRPIDVVTVDPQPATSPDAPETAFSSAKRDEHGQSMLHFAAARTHARNALFQLLQESDVSLGYRDELYRTARDVSTQANVPENTIEIDRFVLHLAARGETDKIMELVMEGYDHILDVVDEEGASITDVVTQRGDPQMTSLLASIPAFEDSRDVLLAAVRRGDLAAVKTSVEAEGGRTLVRSHNSFGRTALHIAVLAENEELVAYLAQTCPELLRIGDNLERTPLHYAMGVQKIESLSRVLIRAGAKRVLKDLKGRQPSYYFMNKSDILRLQEEEEIY